MKNASTNTLAFLTIAALATVSSAQPESDIATPAEKVEITQSAPDLGQSEKENWLRLREERKQARQQILSDIKANAKAEIKDIQEDLLQQKPNNNKNESKEVPLSKGQLQKKNKELKGIGNLEKPRPGLLPHETPRPIEHISYPKESKF
jgi:hypothetical protein